MTPHPLDISVEDLVTHEQSLALAQGMTRGQGGFTDNEFDAVHRWAAEGRLRMVLLELIVEGKLLVTWKLEEQRPHFTVNPDSILQGE